MFLWQTFEGFLYLELSLHLDRPGLTHEEKRNKGETVDLWKPNQRFFGSPFVSLRKSCRHDALSINLSTNSWVKGCFWIVWELFEA